MVNTDFNKLAAAQTRAEMAMLQGLKQRWPEGSAIKVFLSTKQSQPTEATVIYYNASRQAVRVRLNKPNRWGNQHVTDVHWSRCD